ncbi:MAG: C10 family peptidase [Muribaculum sp.]|nr:C10 family peptidase [Muribaculum sp.]
MKIKFPILFIIIMFLSTGCSQEILYESEETVESYDNNKISKIIYEYYNKLHNDTRSNGNHLIIKKITSETYQIPDSLRTGTRSSNEDTFDIHTVTVDFGESTGYVILSNTPGIEQVFCYTESGCVSDTALIPPLKDFIEATPSVAVSILKDKLNQPKQATRTTEYYDIGPLVPFEWHQEVPFNNSAEYCTCDSCKKRGNHRLVGCCAIAAGEFMATMKRFNGTFYGNRNIDFDRLLKYSHNSYGDRVYTDAEACQAAQYLQEVGLTCQTKYGCKGSSSTAKSVANCLIDNGYSVDVVDGFLDKARYIANLKNGIPHIVSGHSNNGAHMWIIDGIQTVDEENLIHCNWGWGKIGSNGWYSSYYFYFVPRPDPTTGKITYGEGEAYNKSQQQLYIKL